MNRSMKGVAGFIVLLLLSFWFPSVLAAERRQVDLLPDWTYGLFGPGASSAGLIEADLDGDLIPEIVATSFGGPVALKRAGSEYRILWFGEKLNLDAIAIGNAGGGGSPTLYGANTDGDVFAFHGATGERFAATNVISSGYNYRIAVCAGDVDGDGQVEAVVTTEGDTFVLDGTTLATKWTAAGKGGTGVAIGDIDGNGKVEIVVNSTTAHILDAYAKKEKWAWAGGFGSRFSLGDTDGEGIPEIVYCKDNDGIYVFDATSFTDLKKVSLSEYYASCTGLAVADLDGDGNKEILAAIPTYSGGFFAFRGSDGTQVGLFPWDGYMYGIVVGDLDGNGLPDLLWGDSQDIEGGRGLTVGDWTTGATLWQNVGLFRPLATTAADVDGDGLAEILTFSLTGTNSYENKGLVTCYNSRTHAVKWTIPDISIYTSYYYMTYLLVGQMDGDPSLELVITSGDSYGPMKVYDIATRMLQWTAPPSGGGSLVDLAVADADHDGIDELIAAYSDGVVSVYHGASNLIQWQTSGVLSQPIQLEVADLMGDAYLDVAVLTDSDLFIFDMSSDTQALLSVPNAQAFGVIPSAKRASLDILVARSSGYYGDRVLECYRPTLFPLQWSMPLADYIHVNKILSADLDQDGETEFVLAGSSAEDYYGPQKSYVLIASAISSSGCWTEYERSFDDGAFVDATLADLAGDSGLDLLLTDSTLFHVEQIVSHPLTCTLDCDASAAPSSGTPPLTVTFTATAMAEGCIAPPSFEWEFGDGDTSDLQNPSHVYSSVGTFTWTLTVEADGLTCSKTGSVTVQPPCQLACAATVPAAGAVGTPVGFQASATPTNCSGTVAYAWSFGDGGTSAAQNPSHAYASAGTFSWSMTASLSGATCSKTGSITIAAPCTLSCTASVPATGTEGVPVSFQSTATPDHCTGSPTFSWAFGDGETSTEQNASHLYASAGTFTWALTAEVEGITCTKGGSITIAEPPVCTLTCHATVPSYSLPGDAVAFASEALPFGPCSLPVTYSWNFGDGETSAEQNPLHAYASDGPYDWSVAATSGDVTCHQSGRIVVSTGCCAADVNCDGVVNVMDMIRIQRCILGLDAGAACASSDVNRDGVVNIMDQIKVQRVILGLDICP